MHEGFLLETQTERDYLEDPEIYGRIIIKWILKKWTGRA
jgi:hypothetical protein